MARTTKELTTIEVENVKSGTKPKYLFDGKGLFLLVTPTGGKWWRFKYRYANKGKLLSFGTYPEVSLEQAREQREDARKLLAIGIDPSVNRKTMKSKKDVVQTKSLKVITGQLHQYEKKEQPANPAKEPGKKISPQWGKPVIVFNPKKDFQKKLNPRWGKPVIVFDPKKEFEKKLTPKWGKPVFVNSPKSKVPLPETAPSSTPTTAHKLEAIEQVSANVPVIETTETAVPPPSYVPASDHNVVQPTSVKSSYRKIVFGALIPAAVLLCILTGYWFSQMKKSEKNMAYVSSQEAVETSPVVNDKRQAQVGSKQSKPNEEDIRNLITKWLTSWQSGNIENYRSCYASDFQSKGKNLEAWISHKANVFKKSKKINISIDNLQISADVNKAKAIFTQHYSSSITKDSGRKTLELRKINNEWKIYKETM